MSMSSRALVLVVVAAAVALGSQPPTQDPPDPKPDPATPAAPAPSQPPAESTEQPELREAVVLLRDGQRYTGLLVSRDDEKVVLRIGGIDTNIPTAQIDRVSVLAPVLERYKAIREAIDDNDVENLMRLVEWLRVRAQWDAALEEADHILKVQPDHPEARRLRNLVVSQKKLAEAAGKGTKRPAGSPRATEEPDFPLLADRDINAIKVYEIDLNDPPRLLVERRTIDKLLKEHAGDPALPSTAEGRDALYRAAPARVLELLFKVQARNLYTEVQVLDNPRSMRLFRDEVQRSWLVNSCATSRCHGGSGAGRLRLCNKKPGAEGPLYTNFLILDRYRLADGRPLINYDDPASSPLLHMALPRDPSRRGHPVVPGAAGTGDLWRPVFASMSDRRYEAVIDWMKAMYRPRPEYPVVYSPLAPLEPRPAEPAAPR